jgi:DegV family protein with EDD domain
MLTITTDSCADLSENIISTYGIKVIPLHVSVNGKDYHDNELPISDLFSSVHGTGELPKTAAPSTHEFIKYFDTADPLLYIGLSSQLSATMQNALFAADQLKKDDLYIIDSLNLSTGIGLLVLKAFDLHKAGFPTEEIIDQIKALRSKVKTAFVIDTMEYLHKGGRCSGLQAVVGSLLQIRPIIHVQTDGTLGVLDKVRGSREKALDALIGKFKNHLPNIDMTRVFVTHTGCIDDANYLVESLHQLAPIEDIFVTQAGATIASHCGPNTIGILYISQ